MRGFRRNRRGITAVPFPKDIEEEMVELIGGDGCIREVLDGAYMAANRWVGVPALTLFALFCTSRGWTPRLPLHLPF